MAAPPGGNVLAAAFSTSGNATTVLEWLGSLAWFGVAALPISMGVAILKYRLYDIGRIISRTLAYAAVTGLLIGVYAGLVLLATHVLAFATPVTVADFAARLEDAVDLDSVRADLAGVVHQALEPAHVSVWLSERG
jgi:hypothetical protein